jgi:hypothetical protein
LNIKVEEVEVTEIDPVGGVLTGNVTVNERVDEKKGKGVNVENLKRKIKMYQKRKKREKGQGHHVNQVLHHHLEGQGHQ